MSQTTTTYAIVRTPGCYGSGEIVRPAATRSDRRAALALARSYTREYQARMRRHGGSSGGYRVVQCEDRSVSWRGHELDRVPSVE